jgi:hypothetical protein
MIENGVLDEKMQANLVSALSGNNQDEENKRVREELLEEIKA